MIIGLVVLGERLSGLREVAQTPSQVSLSQPFYSLFILAPRFSGNAQLACRDRVTVPLGRWQARRIQVEHQLRGGAVHLRACLRWLVAWFINDDLVRAGREVSHFKVAFIVRKDAAEDSRGVRFQFHRDLARGPIARFQEHGAGNDSLCPLGGGGLRLRRWRPHKRSHGDEKVGKKSSCKTQLLYVLQFAQHLDLLRTFEAFPQETWRLVESIRTAANSHFQQSFRAAVVVSPARIAPFPLVPTVACADLCPNSCIARATMPIISSAVVRAA